MTYFLKYPTDLIKKLMNFGVYKQLRDRDYKQIYLRAIRGKIDLLINFLSSMSINKVASKPQNSLIAPCTALSTLSISHTPMI